MHRFRQHTFAAMGLVVVFTGSSLANADVSDSVRISGTSVVSGCTADDPDSQGGEVFLDTEVESYVVVNPTDQSHFVATWQQDRWSNGGSRAAGVAVSFDKGKTWQGSAIPDLTLCTGGVWERSSDPWLTFAPNGDLYQNSLVLSRTGPYHSGMTVSKSTDGGLTWAPPVVLVDDTDQQRLHDKNSITADPTDSDYVYSVWDVSTPGGAPAMFSRTTDGGVTWEPAKQIFNGGPAGTVSHQIVVAVESGQPILLDFFVKWGRDPKILMISSDDRGETWSSQTKVIHTAGTQVVTPAVGADVELPVRTFAGVLFDVAIDGTSGVIYLVWEDARRTDQTYNQIFLIASDDLGATWTKPIRVNKTPKSDVVARSNAFIPSVAVAPNGVVAVSYYDFRNDTDGPKTLTDYWAVTCKPTEPLDCTERKKWNRQHRLTSGSFNIERAPFAGGLFLGDYQGLAPVNNASFVAVFARPTARDKATLFTRNFNRK